MRRLFAVMVVLVVSWLNLTPMAIAAPATQVAINTYDSGHHPALIAKTMTERGPPFGGDTSTAAYDAVDPLSHGASARLGGTTLAAVSNYDSPAVPVQVAGPTATSALALAAGSYWLRPLLQVAANTPRGVSKVCGQISEEGTNAAGGRLITSTGAINQNDFAPYVERAMIGGDSVEILTGAHWLPSGAMTGAPRCSRRTSPSSATGQE